MTSLYASEEICVCARYAKLCALSKCLGVTVRIADPEIAFIVTNDGNGNESKLESLAELEAFLQGVSNVKLYGD